MDKTKEEFITMVRQAMNDRTCSSYSELYNFLSACFVRADTNLNGRIYPDMFDALIDEAAVLPRRYGFAPKNEDMYPSSTLRKAARAKMFADMDTDNNGYITLEEWIDFAVTHIESKMAQIPKDYLSGSSKDVSKEEFIAFAQQATNKSSSEYRELYYFLLKNFEKGDIDRTGEVDAIAFDLMIEDAAAAPRRYGLAPKTSEMFRNDRERLNKRTALFREIDRRGRGKITFNDWLEYATRHITGKVNTL